MTPEAKVIVAVLAVSVLGFIGLAVFGSDTKEGGVVSDAILVREDSQAKGAATSTVTIVEFADFECGPCGAAQPVVDQTLAEYGSRVRFVFRNFPLHTNSVLAAEAAEAAGEQGKFWEMHAKLFASQTEWGGKRDPQTEIFARYARELGLDEAAFRGVLAGTKYELKVARDQADGAAAGVRGTPTFFVNGKVLSGVPTYADLKALIDAELAG
jgi:protein-disulfide isomerase